jgi:integrase
LPRGHATRSRTIARVETAFVTLAADAGDETERSWIEQARVVFLFVYATGLRRGELLGLRWRNVHLADPAGPSLRVCETIVHGRADTPKSAASERTIAIGPKLSEELFDHRARTSYAGDDELVFCHPRQGVGARPQAGRGHVPYRARERRDHRPRRGGAG